MFYYKSDVKKWKERKRFVILICNNKLDLFLLGVCWCSVSVNLMCRYLCVCVWSMCSLVIMILSSRDLFSHSSKNPRGEQKMNLTSLCCVPQIVYLFDAWLILTFPLKLSVTVCIHDMCFSFAAHSERKWILTFTNILHLCSIKYATGVIEAAQLFKKAWC